MADFDDDDDDAEERSRLLGQADRLIQEATQRYFDWVRLMLSLSFAGLTALVALQGNYTPDTDLGRYFLWATFGSLASSVVCSAIVLRGQGQSILAVAHQIASDVQKPPENRSTRYAAGLPHHAKIARRILPWALVLSVLCLSSFGIVNSLRPDSPVEHSPCMEKPRPR